MLPAGWLVFAPRARPPEHLARHRYDMVMIRAVSSVRENVRVALQRKLRNSFHFWRSEKVLSRLDARALELVENGTVDPTVIISHTLPLEPGPLCPGK